MGFRALLAILWAIAVSATAAYADARSIKVTKTTLSQFVAYPSGGSTFTCWKQRASRASLGTIDKLPLTAGRHWRPFDRQQLKRKIASTTKTIRLLQRSGTKGRKIERLNAQLRGLRETAQFATDAARYCKNGTIPNVEPTIPPGGEFVGSSESLEPYRDALSPDEVRHLLNKVAFGGSPRLYEIGARQGLTALVDALVDGIGSADELKQLEDRTQFWASKAFFFNEFDPDLAGVRIWTTNAAQIGQTYRSIFTPDPLREWMTLQLSAHYSVNMSRIGFSYSAYGGIGIERHWTLLHDSAFGNLRSLTKSMLRDPAMNFWLNNKDNRVGEPNQNFARELLELFTIGAIDPVTRQSNYGEESINAATAFMSGFIELPGKDPVTGRDAVGITFEPALHDPAPMSLFPSIPGAATNRSFVPEALIDHIFDNHPGAPRYLADRFGGMLLYPGLSESVVAKLAEQLQQSNYELKPFLKRVLRSRAMFSPQARRVCVSSPFEGIIRLARRLPPILTVGDDNERASYETLYIVMAGAGDAGQSIFEPPSVFGWKGSCNINRAGNISRGEGWLPAQLLLSRSRACISYMNYINQLNFDFVGALGLNPLMSARQIVDRVATVVYDVPIQDAAATALVRFLETERDDAGHDRNVVVDLTDDYYVRRKLPRLICLEGDTIDAMRR